MGQKGEEKVHPTRPLPMAPSSYRPWHCYCSSQGPSQQPLDSANGTVSQRCPFRQAAACFYRKFQQHFLHYFPSRASLKRRNICIQREKNSFCHQKAVEKFTASYLQAHAHWTLICPHLLCGSSNVSSTRHWPATGSWFFESPFCEDGRGLCCSPPCVHY